jgi:hypothetical protein
LPAPGALAKKVQLVMGDLIAGLPRHFFRNFIQGRNLRIKNLAAPGANHMGMGVWPVAS